MSLIIEFILSLVITILFVFIFLGLYSMYDLPKFIFCCFGWSRDPIVMLVFIIILYKSIDHFLISYINPYFTLPKTSINLLSNLSLAFFVSLYAGYKK